MALSLNNNFVKDFVSNEEINSIAGKGHEKYIIDDKGTHYFDEKEIVCRAMKERKERQENLWEYSCRSLLIPNCLIRSRISK